MKREITDKMDELLYQYMPLAEEKWMAALQERAEKEPHVFSERFERNVARIMEEYDREEKKRKKRKSIIKRAAAVFFIIVSVSFALCISVEATRESFIEFIRKIHSDWTEYKYDLEEGKEAEFKLIKPTYLPEGYSEYDSEKLDNWINIYYRNEEREEHGEIEYMICQAEGLTVGLDTENATIKKKEIGGEEVEYFENDGIGYVYWTDEDTYYSFSGYVNVDEMLKMAESVINSEKYKEK